jgi:hypothetical protein
MTNITYWGDMLDSVNAWVSANYTQANPYKGPNGDGTLDGRITRNGDGDDTYEPGDRPADHPAPQRLARPPAAAPAAPRATASWSP